MLKTLYNKHFASIKPQSKLTGTVHKSMVKH